MLNYQIIISEGATVASTVTYLLPVVAIVLGVVVLGESITVTTLAGIALVLVGVALTRRRAKPANDEKQVELALELALVCCYNFLYDFRAHLRRAGLTAFGRKQRERPRAVDRERTARVACSRRESDGS